MTTTEPGANMSPEQMEQFRADLQAPERFGTFLDAALDRTYSDAGLADGFLAAIKRTYRDSATLIAEQSESPIEAMLFNAFILGSAIVDGNGVLVRKIERDSVSYLADVRRTYAAIRHIEQQAKKRADKGTTRDYIDWLEREQRIDHAEAEHWRTQDIGSALFGRSYQIIPQAVIPGLGPSGKKIRVDALMYVLDRPDLTVVVECDGYEWHGNKDSFTADRKRDRRLKEAGYEVVRFSGSEIFRDPGAAAMDLYDQLGALRKRSKTPRTWWTRATEDAD